jgi:hypothetical protein
VVKIHTQKLAVTRGSLFAGKLQGNEADQLSPSSAMVKNEWKHTSNLPDAFMVLIRAILLSLYCTILYFTLHLPKKNGNYNWSAQPKSIYDHSYGRVLPHRM